MGAAFTASSLYSRSESGADDAIDRIGERVEIREHDSRVPRRLTSARHSHVAQRVERPLHRARHVAVVRLARVVEQPLAHDRGRRAPAREQVGDEQSQTSPFYGHLATLVHRCEQVLPFS